MQINVNTNVNTWTSTALTSPSVSRHDLESRLEHALARRALCRAGLAQVARDRMDIEVYETALIGSTDVGAGLKDEYETAAEAYEDTCEEVEAAHEALDALDATPV